MKILIFKIGAMGDVLMTTPFVKNLRYLIEDAEIHYLVGQSYSEVLSNNPDIDKIKTFDETILFDKNIKQTLKLISTIKKENYDMCFTLDKHWITPLLVFLSGIKIRYGFSRSYLDGFFLNKKIKYSATLYEGFTYQMLLSMFNPRLFNIDGFLRYITFLVSLINPKGNKLIYNPSQRDQFNFKSLSKILNKKYCVLINSGGDNTGEKSQVRRMPDDKFKQLVDKISEKYKVVFLGTYKEKQYYDKFKNKNTIELTGLRLGVSAIIMKHAKRIYTTDCGAMHLAATQQNSITCFFGPTSPEVKAPKGNRVRINWTDSDVYDKEYELYGKIPDKKYFTKLDISKVK